MLQRALWRHMTDNDDRKGTLFLPQGTLLCFCQWCRNSLVNFNILICFYLINPFLHKQNTMIHPNKSSLSRRYYTYSVWNRLKFYITLYCVARPERVNILNLWFSVSIIKDDNFTSHRKTTLIMYTYVKRLNQNVQQNEKIQFVESI